jgi:hypothetical protein
MNHEECSSQSGAIIQHRKFRTFQSLTFEKRFDHILTKDPNIVGAGGSLWHKLGNHSPGSAQLVVVGAPHSPSRQTKGPHTVPGAKDKHP